MKSQTLTRRGFCAAAGWAAMNATLYPQTVSKPRSLRLGGPVFLKTDDPVELAHEHRRLGYRSAYCPPVDLKDSRKIETIRKAYAAQDVIIAEVGAWKNMLDADPQKRQANLDYVANQLALAEAVGALCCVDIAGSFNPKEWDGPDPRNYSKEFIDATVENCRKVIDAVKPKRAKFTLEMMPWAIPDGPENYLQLIKAIDRPAFSVHVDVCNIVNTADRFLRNAALIEDCFKKLGRWIVSCHAKDLKGERVESAAPGLFQAGWKLRPVVETVPGRGKMDYRAYLRAIAAYAPAAPLLLEHLSTAEEYDEGRNYIQRVATAVGLSFS